jgi:hypothetical protein
MHGPASKKMDRFGAQLRFPDSKAVVLWQQCNPNVIACP